MRIAIIYDDSVRADTTGGYCFRALEKMAREVAGVLAGNGEAGGYKNAAGENQDGAAFGGRCIHQQSRARAGATGAALAGGPAAEKREEMGDCPLYSIDPHLGV